MFVLIRQRFNKKEQEAVLGRFICFLITTAVFSAFGGIESRLFSQEPSHSYRSFSTQITPSQLNRLLGSSNAVQKKIVSDKIAEMVKDKFQTLSPQQKKRLAEISSEFAKGKESWRLAEQQEALERAISQDPELRRAAEQLRSELRSEEFNNEAIDRREIERSIRDEVQQRLQRELGQYQGGDPSGNQYNSSSRNQIGRNDDPFNQFSNPGNSQNPFNESGKDIESGRFYNGDNRNRNGDPRSFENGNPGADPFTDPGNRSGSGQNGSPRSGYNGSSSPQNSFKGNNGPGSSGSGNQQKGGSGSESLTPPSRGPYGGFSDDGNNSTPGSSDGSNVASASGQNGQLPKESVGHKFNRMLMNSFEKAMEKKLGSDSVDGQQSFQRVLNKFVDSVSNSNPQFSNALGANGRGLFDRLESGIRRGRSRVNMSMPNWSRFGSSGPSSFGGGGMGMSLPALSVRGVVTFLLVLGLIIGVVVFALKKTPLAQILGLQQPIPGPGPAPEINIGIRDYDEIVELIDRFTLWLFGRKADWWHSKKIQAEVGKLSPEVVQDIQSMMKIYDEARYAPSNQSVSPETVNEVKAVLGRLKDLAQDKSRTSSEQVLQATSNASLHTA